MGSDIHWNDTIKKEARGGNDEDLVDVQRCNRWLCFGSKRYDK